MNTEERAPETSAEPPAPPAKEPQSELQGGEDSTAELLDPIVASRVEEEDRKRPIPGGEPECPACGAKMVRRVERYPAPHGGSSPFRVRLVCPEGSCGAWTVYDW